MLPVMLPEIANYFRCYSITQQGPVVQIVPSDLIGRSIFNSRSLLSRENNRRYRPFQAAAEKKRGAKESALASGAFVDCDLRSVEKREKKMGVEKQILKAGTGPKPVKGQNVTVHCTGYGKDGDLSKKFWSTKDPGQEPFSFKIGMGSVIKGWDEGVLNMQIGEVARLQCTPDYAYGPSGFPAWGIRPNSPLIFEIEVLSAM